MAKKSPTQKSKPLIPKKAIQTAQTHLIAASIGFAGGVWTCFQAAQLNPDHPTNYPTSTLTNHETPDP
jgi:hypothetical protein